LPLRLICPEPSKLLSVEALNSDAGSRFGLRLVTDFSIPKKEGMPADREDFLPVLVLALPLALAP